MDAVEYLKAKERMFASMRHCIGCDNCEYGDFCNGVMTNEKQVALVEQWAKEHPIKTYKSEFLEKFPDALVDELCVKNIFGCKHKLEQCINTKTFISYCNSCWHREFKGWS